MACEYVMNSWGYGDFNIPSLDGSRRPLIFGEMGKLIQIVPNI